MSYTHADNQPDDGLQWVTKFTSDLKARLEIVSGHTVDIWRDENKLGAADRFDESIEIAIRDTAVLLVVLSPSYFNSRPCEQERQSFYAKIAREQKESAGGKSRIVKAAKFRVALDKYPADLRVLLEHRFYVELPGPAWKEFHLSDDTSVRDRYKSKVDDVAQEIAGLLTALEPASAQEQMKGVVYLAEGTSDVEPQRDTLKRELRQLGFDVQPKRELRLLPAADVRGLIADAMREARLAIYPVGAFYGFVPEGADGKSLVQIQLEIAQADARNGDVARIIWVPEGLVVQESAQKEFLARIRTEFAGHGFELLERPFRALETRVTDQLRAPAVSSQAATQPSSGVYLICDNADRALAKNLRSFIFNQRQDVEWTPVETADLAGNQEHQKLLRRNRTHLVVHGETSEAWLQDRVRELNASRQPGMTQAIYLANPRRQDKEDILVRDITLIQGYPPATVGAAIGAFLSGSGA